MSYYSKHRCSWRVVNQPLHTCFNTPGVYFGAKVFGFCVWYQNHFNNKICIFTFSRNSCSSWWVFVTVVTERSDQFTWFKKKKTTTTHTIQLFLRQELTGKKPCVKQMTLLKLYQYQQIRNIKLICYHNLFKTVKINCILTCYLKISFKLHGFQKKLSPMNVTTF